MKKQLLILLAVLWLISACSSETPTPTADDQTLSLPAEVTETAEQVSSETPEPSTYDLTAVTPLADFGFSIPYPANWFAEVAENQLTISDTEAQLDPPLTQPPLEARRRPNCRRPL